MFLVRRVQPSGNDFELILTVKTETRHPVVVTLARPPLPSSLKITDRAFRYMLHLVFEISSLCIFIFFILVPIPPFPTHLFHRLSLLPVLIHHSAHP